MGLFDKFKKKNITSEKNNIVEDYNVKFPFYVNVYKKDFNEESGDEPIELKEEEAYKFLTNDKIEEICFDFESSELYQYWDGLNKKIVNMKMQFLENGFIKVTIFVRDNLTDDDKQKLLKLISGQMSDGWGEGNFEYTNENNNEYRVIFWKYNDWNIEYI